MTKPSSLIPCKEDNDDNDNEDDMKTMTMTMRSNLASEWESKEGARGCGSCEAWSDPDLCLGMAQCA